MRSIKKDLTQIPGSLRFDPASIRHNPAKTTYQRILQVISDGKYPDSSYSSNYDSRYKMDDIKDQLKAMYLGKCAYCETYVEQMVVEHYRPKRGGYYWLAFSWDNLLLACPTCNGFKGDVFPISKTRVVFDSTRDTMERLHQLGFRYDKLERPLLVNPERALPSEISSIRFDQEGQISSENERMSQTIETCQLHRKALCERRKKIWDDFRKEIALAVLLAGDDKDDLRIRFDQVVKSFALKSKDPAQDFTAFRQFVLKNKDWISGYLKDLIE